MLDLSEQKWPEAEISALKGQMYKENLPLRDEVERASMFEEIVGTSKPLKAVLSQIAKVAPTYSTVLITVLTRRHSNCFSHTPGLETYANYRT